MKYNQAINYLIDKVCSIDNMSLLTFSKPSYNRHSILNVDDSKTMSKLIKPSI